MITKIITKIHSNGPDPKKERTVLSSSSIVFDDCVELRKVMVVFTRTNQRLLVAMPEKRKESPCDSCGCMNFIKARYCNSCGNQLLNTPPPLDKEGRPIYYSQLASFVDAESRAMVSKIIMDNMDWCKKTNNFMTEYDTRTKEFREFNYERD